MQAGSPVHLRPSVLSIAHRGYVLQTGEIVLSDTAANLKKNEMVKKAYLGVE